MTLIAGMLALVAAVQDVRVDLSKYDRSCDVMIERRDDVLAAAWNADGRVFSATFALDGAPLIASLDVENASIARNVRPLYIVTTGNRKQRPGVKYIFFDKPARGPKETHEAALDLKSVRVESAGRRVAIRFSRLSAGPFSGELVVRIYAGSPFLHLEGAMAQGKSIIAYIYDFVLDGDFPRVAWKDTADRWRRRPAAGGTRALAVRNRAIFAESDAGTVAVFPPPHAFFFPRDYSDNFKFARIGEKRFGLRQDPAGGPGHKGAFIPWFDARAGEVQRMGAFLLLSPLRAEGTLERVKRYTHGDRFLPMEGRVAMSSHWHTRITVAEMAGRPTAPEVVRVFRNMGVQIVHLAEFHGDGHARDTGKVRLNELKAMFELCRRYSDEEFLFIPGEEANVHLNKPTPKGMHSGHWMYLFPKEVYLTLKSTDEQPFEETIEPYGKVYHPHNEKEMVEILMREKGLAWSAHPRIKSSTGYPDAYKEKDWYKSDMWLGGAWKSMPSDLSTPRLGVRVLDLLDDMNNWGQKKIVPGEVDCFTLDRTHELYGHMNVNYLKLPKIPSYDDWSPVLDVLRRGDFFVTTGEVLIHDFRVRDGKARAELQWTFPLEQVELVVSDGRKAKRRTLPLPATKEFGRRTFEWDIDAPSAAWARLEAWDVAFNGAFTQPVWLR